MPGSFVDVQALDVDYLAFSFHKLLAPFGVGALYAKEHLLASSLPFLYGGDMIAEGRVFPDRVDYTCLPWKYAAGTPNIWARSSPPRRCASCWTWRSRQNAPPTSGLASPSNALPSSPRWAASRRGTGSSPAGHWTGSAPSPGLTIYGPRDPARRTSLVAFNAAGRDPVAVAEA